MTRRLRAALGSLAIVAALLPGPAATASACQDPLVTRVRGELARFTGWLQRHGVQGYVGEVGWPDDVRGDAAAWNALADAWYADADAAGLWVTSWATGEWWGDRYPLAVYEDRVSPAGVETPDTQAAVVERHPTTGATLRGVNVAGGEFGTPGPLEATASFSNANPGVYDRAYHYDLEATFEYLAGRGVRLVRIPFRWERVQPRLRAPLDPAELERLAGVVQRAHAAGLAVVLDVHNYGAYWLSDGTQGVRRPIGSAEVTVADFTDLWRRLSQRFVGTPGLAGYGLMNEPVAMPGGAAGWEAASRQAVAAIRLVGDPTTVLVAGYEWSGAQGWDRVHPQPWLEDRAVRYEAHHYWDRDSSGHYSNPYLAEVADAESRGWAGTCHDADSPSAACPPERVPEDGFDDVAPTDVHEPSIDCAVWWGLARGTGTGYAPARLVSRAQLATLLVGVLEAADVPLQPPDNRFADDNGSPHEANIDRLAAAGVLQGTGPGTFAPDAGMTRAQLATALLRTAELAAGRPLPQASDRFADDDASPHESNIDRAAAAGLLSGTGATTFSPDLTVRRGQMASFLVRLLDLLVREGRASPPA